MHLRCCATLLHFRFQSYRTLCAIIGEHKISSSLSEQSHFFFVSVKRWNQFVSNGTKSYLPINHLSIIVVVCNFSTIFFPPAVLHKEKHTRQRKARPRGLSVAKKDVSQTKQTMLSRECFLLLSIR